MEDQDQSGKAPQSVQRDNTDMVESEAIQLASIQSTASELVKSSTIRWAAGGLTSSFIVLAWVARIRSIRRDLHQEQELQHLQETQRQQDETSTEVDIDTPVFKKDSFNVLIPSPPRPPMASQKGTSTPSNLSGNTNHRSSGLCSLCNEPRIHPTASTGGYVFCLKCILEFLRENGGVCPVSRKPCPESSLVRLYEPTHHI